MSRTHGSMRTRAATLALVCLVLVGASCGEQAALSTSASGPAATAAVLRGVVRAGPSCPDVSVSRHCGYRPLSGMLVRAVPVAQPGAGGDSRRQAASVAPTNGEGSFALRVPPGSYQLRVETTGPFPRCPLVTVRLAPGSERHVVISCDSGVR
jgi:hypothetical protein